MPPIDGKSMIEDVCPADLDGDVQVRMESLARMGTALAGDLMPLLTVLNNILQLARVGLDKGEPTRQVALDSLATADRAMDSATTLLRRLEEFGRCTSGRPRRIDLSDFVKSRMPCMSRVLGCNVQLDIEVSDEPAPVDIDPKQLERILSEILRNSCEAMRGCGRISVRIEHASDLESDAPHVRLIIEDDGPGMDSSTMSRALEPFFTTKHHDVGIGLGLSIAYATVRAAGGRITLSGMEGVGVRVSVDLPMQEIDDSSSVESRDIESISPGPALG